MKPPHLYTLTPAYVLRCLPRPLAVLKYDALKLGA